MIPSFRIKQLTEDQLALLVHAFKDAVTDSNNGIIPSRLSALNMRVIIPRLMQLQNTLTEEGQGVLKGLVTTLTSPYLPVS